MQQSKVCNITSSHLTEVKCTVPSRNIRMFSYYVNFNISMKVKVWDVQVHVFLVRVFSDVLVAFLYFDIKKRKATKTSEKTRTNVFYAKQNKIPWCHEYLIGCQCHTCATSQIIREPPRNGAQLLRVRLNLPDAKKKKNINKIYFFFFFNNFPDHHFCTYVW